MKTVIAIVTLAVATVIGRHVSRGTACVRAGQWSDKKYLVGTELYGKTLAVIGLGRIGREVALRMQAFGMKVNLPTAWLRTYTSRYRNLDCFLKSLLVDVFDYFVFCRIFVLNTHLLCLFTRVFRIIFFT